MLGASLLLVSPGFSWEHKLAPSSSEPTFIYYVKARFQACSPHGLICLIEGQVWVSWAQVCPEIMLLGQTELIRRFQQRVSYPLLSMGCLEDKWGDHRGVHCKMQLLLRAG